MSEEVELPALEEETEVEVVKRPALTPAQKQEMLDSIGEGTSITDAARKAGVSISYASQEAKKIGLKVGAVKAAREIAEEAAKAAAIAKVKITFAEQRLQRIEDYKNRAFAALTLSMNLSIKSLQEAARYTTVPGGSPPMSAKEKLIVDRSIALTSSGLRLLLDLDGHIAPEELPEIHIRDLSDDEIKNLREGHSVDYDPLAALDGEDEIVSEESA